MTEEEEDVTMNRAPKAASQFAREKELQARQDGMVPPDPEVDTETTSVPRSEMMSDLPPERKDKPGWMPPKID